MSVVNPRNRLVNFRLSEAEFSLMKETCFAAGARSVSEFARTAVLWFLERAAGGAEINGGPDNGNLDRRLRELEDRVAHLTLLVENSSEGGSLPVAASRWPEHRIQSEPASPQPAR